MTLQKAITNYEVMFATRTGVTILVPKMEVLDEKSTFTVIGGTAGQVSDIRIESPKDSVVLKDFKKDYLDEAMERGFIMFYETVDEEVVRCSTCTYRK